MQAQYTYPTKIIAAMIAARLAKSKGVAYEVTKVPTGFRVAPKVAPAIKTVAGVLDAIIANDTGKTSTGKTWTDVDKCEIVLRFRGESPKYIDAWIDGKAVSFGKETLIAWDVYTPDGALLKEVRLTMPVKTAKKRGLI